MAAPGGLLSFSGPCRPRWLAPSHYACFCLSEPNSSSICDAMAEDERRAPDDPTPIIAAPTDVAPLSRQTPKPAHERTADEEADVIDWERLAASERFRELIKAKRRFVVPAMIFFIV